MRAQEGISGQQTVTPEQYLAEHALTLYLKQLGITERQLAAVRFSKGGTTEFSEWAVRSGVLLEADGSWTAVEGWPIQAFENKPAFMHEAMRAWCTLRWLILENPPESRDRRDAWTFVSLYLAQDMFEAARKQINNLASGRTQANEQRERAADQRVIDKYRAWEKRAHSQLAGKNTKERLKDFRKSSIGKALTQRERRRITSLAKAGEL